MYKDAIKKHAYTCAMDQVEERYVPIEEFIAEQEKVQVCLDLTYYRFWHFCIVRSRSSIPKYSW